MGQSWSLVLLFELRSRCVGQVSILNTFVLSSLMKNLKLFYFTYTVTVLAPLVIPILMPISLVPAFTHRGRLVIRGCYCSIDQPTMPPGIR